MPSVAFIESRSRAWMALLACLLLATTGCATRKPDRSLPTRELAPLSASGDVIAPDRWWTEFGNPELNHLVEQALGENYELAVALQRLRSARALARREASDLLPDLNGVIGTDSVFGPGPNRTRVSWGLDAAYQVDLWGQIESRVDAERFRADATQADYHAVALSLAAEVARTWFSIIEAEAQLELLQKQLQTNRKGLVAANARFEASAGGGLPDVLRQKQLVESTLEQQVVVRARAEILEHQLAVLVGELPQTAQYKSGTELPELPPLPSTGSPSELLMRRPDVRRDYLAFAAADRDLAAAVSAQYPRLNLTGSLINSADNAETLFRDWFASIGSQLVAPLLDGGQRRAEVDRTAAQVYEQFNAYGQSMLIAFREVEDNLALERYQIQRIERLKTQERFAGEASFALSLRLATEDASFLDILSSVQSEQRLQREILSARLDLILIRIGLYLALAGDFDTCPQLSIDSPHEGRTEIDQQDSIRQTDQSASSDSALLPPPEPSEPAERLPPVEASPETNVHD